MRQALVVGWIFDDLVANEEGDDHIVEDYHSFCVLADACPDIPPKMHKHTGQNH